MFILQGLAAKRHQEFVGNGQHDAQELLTIILDAIHEVQNIQ
jgi:ubiquitin C-terminal hydrolase